MTTKTSKSFDAMADRSRKSSSLFPFVTMHNLGDPVWTSRDYGRLVANGFERNPVVFQCIRLISQSVASVPFICQSSETKKLTDSHLKDLLNYPNEEMEGMSLIEELTSSLLISGDAYLKATFLDAIPSSLYLLRPDRVKVVTDQKGWVKGYDYHSGSHSERYLIDDEKLSPIIHFKLFNPSNDHYGFSPLEAALTSLDVHNSAMAWNKSLLDNAARPSGALIYGGADRNNLTDAQFERLKSELETQFSGATNAGKPLLLEGGLQWQSMSHSPKDMDFLEAKNSAARDIALAFGVPPMLLGIPGDATYANYKEANRAFWRHTIVPLLKKVAAGFSHWWQGFEPDILLKADLDQVDALSEDRDKIWDRMEQISFLTTNEKREALGYPPLEEADR